VDVKQLSRRSFIKYLGGGVAMAGAAMACGPLSSAPSNTTSTTSSTSSQATGMPAPPKRGGTLVLGTITPILNANPYPLNQATATFSWGLFDTLVRLDDRRQPVPHLAESWAFSDDRLTLTFKLRPDVKFHSGRPFTAQDAKWSIEYALDPKTGVTAAGELKGVQTTVRDSSTLELKLPGILPHVFGLLVFIFMIDPQSDIDRAPIGTGPFKLDNLDPGNEMRLVRNPLYWRSDRPYLDAATVRTLPDPSSLIVNLESSAISVAYCPANEVARLRSNSDIATALAPSTGNLCYLINVTTPPFDDQRVRQAMSLAIDRKRFTTTLMYGLTEPTFVMWTENSPAWDAAQDTGEFNLDKARHLLADAGYPKGFETKIQTTSSVLPEFFQFNQVFQSDLAAIGVKATIEDMEFQQYVTTRNQAKFPAILQHSYAYADSDPALAFTATVFRPDGNVTHFKSDEYTRLVTAAKEEPDWNKRLVVYRQITQIVKDEAFLVPVSRTVTPYAMRKNVQGFRSLPATSSVAVVLEDIWLA
jgi:peptide/nickel transport system substrate-binding protein